MALARVKVFLSGEVLYAVDLNNEFNNPLDNALSLISPLTGSLDAGGYDITALDELALNNAAANASAVGRLRRNGNNVHWHDRTGSVALQVLMGGGIFGLTLSNNGSDATNDIDVAVGAAVDSTEDRTLRLTTALTKQLDAAWAVGTNAGMLDTGAIANTTYHIYLIHRSDTGVTDILASTSASAPTMPTSYDYRRRIGSILRESGAIVAFTQDGDYFRRSASVLDVNSTNPGAAAVSYALSVPAGINVFAILIPNGASSGTTFYAFFSDLAASDEAASGSNAQVFVATATSYVGSETLVRTNTSRQIRGRISASDAGTTIGGRTLGWIDTRGRFA